MAKFPTYPTTFIPMPLASEGTYAAIPETKQEAGRVSWAKGFDVETQLPPSNGGVAPNRMDFNGIDFTLSALLHWLQSGGQMKYSPDLNFPTPAVVHHGGRLWFCLGDNGPDTAKGLVAPSSDESVWMDLFKFIYNQSSYRPLKVYELCEFYYFRNPTMKPGFQPAHGGLLQNAAALYPDAWAYLQTTAGQKLCKTEADWQAMTRATWATLADGTSVGWNGIGGAPFYAPNWNTGALRLPDLRGMYAEASGYDSLGIGGVHGDGIRNIVGYAGHTHGGKGGVFYQGDLMGTLVPGSAIFFYQSHFNASRVVPTTSKNQPRAWGALPCVYLGAPK